MKERDYEEALTLTKLRLAAVTLRESGNGCSTSELRQEFVDVLKAVEALRDKLWQTIEIEE